MKLSVAPRSLVLLEYVLLIIVWNWCNNCAWASFLPRANVQTSYVRPTISFLPKTFSHARSLSPRPTHTLRVRCGPPPICFAGYYEISLQEGERGKKQKKKKQRLLAFTPPGTLQHFVQLNSDKPARCYSATKSSGCTIHHCVQRWAADAVGGPAAAPSHRSDACWLRPPAGLF